ncbi:E3 ubiquitin-protein ligase RNF185 isoform X2 [Saimiri boliviensis]|uniref:E3 ubiquitin-protein ligase RNF185 isoform X2 n=1 Tax=Saimiri boliviensis TaxID=27679 RepID=UPI003D780C18
MASKGPSASASPENSSAGGPSGSSNGTGEGGGQDSTFECNICLDTAKDAVISLCGHLFCGWKPDLTDRCVQFAKLASAETRLSPSMEGAALGNRTPDDPLVLKQSHPDESQPGGEEGEGIQVTTRWDPAVNRHHNHKCAEHYERVLLPPGKQDV